VPNQGIFLKDICKDFGDVTAIENVSLSVPEGNFTVLLGPSGCGKSTLLRLMAGLDEPTSGTIRIGGREVQNQPVGTRDLSMVFQSYALFPHLTVADNILFGLQVRKIAKGEQSRRLAEVASMIGLDGLLGRKPAQLSGGQQQRVAVARAVISNRKICLMDEPLSNLDAKLRAEMRQEIRSLQRNLGLTMVYVTHDQIEAVTMADQVVLLNKGRVDQVAAPDVLYSQPETIFTAKFIGTPAMNLIAADSLNKASALNIPDGTVVGIRPEDIIFEADGKVAARVVAQEYQGADRLISCQVGNDELVVRMPARRDAPEIGPTSLSWERTSSHLFDAATGRRLA